MTTLSYALKAAYANKVRDLGGTRYQFLHKDGSPALQMRALQWDAPAAGPYQQQHYQPGMYEVRLSDGVVSDPRNGLRFGQLTDQGLNMSSPSKPKDKTGRKPDYMSDEEPEAPEFLQELADGNEVKDIGGEHYQFSNIDKDRISMRQMPRGVAKYDKSTPAGKLRVIYKKSGLVYSIAGSKVGRFTNSGFAPNSDNNPAAKGVVQPLRDVDASLYDADIPAPDFGATPEPEEPQAIKYEPQQQQPPKPQQPKAKQQSQTFSPMPSYPGHETKNEHVPIRLEDSIGKLVKVGPKIYRVNNYSYDKSKLLMTEYDPSGEDANSRIVDTFLYDKKTGVLKHCCGSTVGKFSPGGFAPKYAEQIGRPDFHPIEKYEHEKKRDKPGDILFSRI